ncbi:MAG: hypothetical protein FJ011_21895 [Chloroflexi bacterium]|nr:hypothetical protein [Chloroflexota bacterium]
MLSLVEMVQRMIRLRQTRGVKFTLLAVCPNSAAVLAAAVKVASQVNAPMLFAATLNQVDRDGGYTGWTPAAFVQELERCRQQYRCASPLYPCLDHGGPWLKDRHTLAGLSLAETTAEVKLSLAACIEAGYGLLHIDPTVDRTLPPDKPAPIEVVVDRTLDLIVHCEAERSRLGAAPVSYEVGTEEVHGGLVDMASFRRFVYDLHDRLAGLNLSHAWPCFIVGKVGTDLHTSFFDPDTAQRLFEVVAPLESLVKGHYTDWVANPEAYPASGAGGAGRAGFELPLSRCADLRRPAQVYSPRQTAGAAGPPTRPGSLLSRAGAGARH